MIIKNISSIGMYPLAWSIKILHVLYEWNTESMRLLCCGYRCCWKLFHRDIWRVQNIMPYHHSSPMTNQYLKGNFLIGIKILSSDENSFISVCILRGYWWHYIYCWFLAEGEARSYLPLSFRVKEKERDFVFLPTILTIFSNFLYHIYQLITIEI